MKNRLLVVSLLLILVLMMIGCEVIPRSKALIVVNESDVDITQLQIREFVQGARDFFMNALAEGEVIEPGKHKTFYLAPYVGGFVSLDLGYESVEFLFDYEVDGKNQSITAVFDGIGVTLSGSNVTEIPPI